MKKILGIDTGGTYTDAAVISADTREILYKSKTMTTKQNLQHCIATCFEKMPSQMFSEISMVCLSTTLATNAIVENHGCKEGLVLIGGRPTGKMPTNRVMVIKGKYDIKGRLKENIDTAEVLQAVESFRGNVDAVAVSGYASVRNPSHEIYVKKVIEQHLDVPVVCAHELTCSLGFYDRTVTADLNAKLIPMVCELMDAVKTVMEQYQVKAPLMIVKGDGRLMTDVCARSKPIETILSGPAASVIGGLHLSGKKDAFVLDMGGTTTDIANVSEGGLNIRNEGAKVGGWSTHVRAAEVFTIGLGGDSRIFLDSARQVRIGPAKSIPLTMAGAQYPKLRQEIENIYTSKAYRHFRHQDEEAYQLIKKYEKLTYDDDENSIIEVLRFSPRTLYYLEETIHIKNIRNILKGLLEAGVIARISLTPTDILHVTGSYRQWDCDIAEMAVRMSAERLGKSEEDFIAEIHGKIEGKLDCACIQAAMYFDHQETDMEEDDSAGNYFLNRLYFSQNSSVLKADYTLQKDIVAIGAPVAAWAAQTGRRLNTGVVIPEHAEVANAVGAAVSRASEEIEILIRPDWANHNYIVYSPLNRSCRKTLEAATEFALKVGEECVQQISENRNYRLETHQEDVCIDDADNGKKIFVERLVIVSVEFDNKPL